MLQEVWGPLNTSVASRTRQNQKGLDLQTVHKRQHQIRRYNSKSAEIAEQQIGDTKEMVPISERSGVTPAQAGAGRSRCTKVKISVSPSTGRKGSARGPRSVKMIGKDLLPETMEQKKRIIHSISSDSESGSGGGNEPLAKRRKTGEGAGSASQHETAVVQEISSDSEIDFEESYEPSVKRHRAGKGTTKATATSRTSGRQIITYRATRQKSEDDEQLQPLYSTSKDHDILPNDTPRADRQCQPSNYAVIPKTPRTKAKAPLDPTAATGVLAQYAIEMIDDNEPMYDAKFQAETKAALALEKPDYRYMPPHGRVTDVRDRANIRRALELTCIDFCQRRGHSVPMDLLAECHNENYMSQYRQIQEEFDRVWNGDEPVRLYCLPPWTKGFDKWKVPGRSGRGAQLKDGGVYPDGKVSFYGLLEQEKRVAKMMKS